MKSANIGAVLFDKDGVLIDFFKSYNGPTRQILQLLSGDDPALLDTLANAVAFDLETEQIAIQSPIVAGSTPDFCAVWAEVLSRENDSAFQTWIDQKYLMFSENNSVLIEGVDDILSALGADYQLGLATNDTEDSARSQLKDHDILNNFSFLAGYDSGYGAKPEIGMAKAFIAHTELAPTQIAMIGDSVHDMTFARDAGMVAIGISTGPMPGQALAGHCDFLIDNLSELPGLLATL